MYSIVSLKSEKETHKDKKIRGQTQKYNLRKPLVFLFNKNNTVNPISSRMDNLSYIICQSLFDRGEAVKKKFVRQPLFVIGLVYCLYK